MVDLVKTDIFLTVDLDFQGLAQNNSKFQGVKHLAQLALWWAASCAISIHKSNLELQTTNSYGCFN